MQIKNHKKKLLIASLVVVLGAVIISVMTHYKTKANEIDNLYTEVIGSQKASGAEGPYDYVLNEGNRSIASLEKFIEKTTWAYGQLVKTHKLHMATYGSFTVDNKGRPVAVFAKMIPFPKTAARDIQHQIFAMSNLIKSIPDKFEIEHYKYFSKVKKRDNYNRFDTISKWQAHLGKVAKNNNSYRRLINMFDVKGDHSSTAMKPFLLTEKNHRLLQKEIDSDIAAIKIVASRIKACRSELNKSLSYSKEANNYLQKLPQYASAKNIAYVEKRWARALGSIDKARNKAYNLNGIKNAQQKTAARAILKAEIANINRLKERVAKHYAYVRKMHAQAQREESTATGKYAWSAKRGFAKFTSWLKGKANQAAQSRIGREVTIAAKTLVLGSKMYFDLLDAPSGNLMHWANSYESDMNKLMRECEEVHAMDGPSLTLKNTIIEDAVNGAYAKSF